MGSYLFQGESGRAASLSLSLFRCRRALLGLCFAATLMTADLAAQSGGHRHIGDLTPGGMLTNRSPLLNRANGYWDFGEAFWAPDYPDLGGVLTPDTWPQIAKQRVTQLRGWTNYSLTIQVPTGSGNTKTVPLQNWIGELKQTPNGEDGFAASFEIVAPQTFPTTGNVVVILATRQTSSSVTNSKLTPHAYPGNPSLFGLWHKSGIGDGYHWPWPGHVIDHFEQNGEEYQVVYAYVVPRVSFRPLTFAVQRLRQLRHVVEDRLVTDSGLQAGNLVYLLGGSSFGGLATQAAMSLYPDEFHAGISSAYSASQRTVINDQCSTTFFGAAMGHGATGAGSTLRDAAEWSIFYNLEQTDAYGISFVNRFRLGHVSRPFYILAADEDLVTSGNEWIRLLDPNNTQAYHAGKVQSSAGAVDVFWSVIGKTCHDSPDPGEPYYIAPNLTTGFHNQMLDAVYEMVDQAWGQRGTSVSRPPASVSLAPGIFTLDIHDHVLDRPAVRTAPLGTTQQAGQTPLLAEASGWKRFGNGLWLGSDESVKIAKTGPTGTPSVFVGSADGIVTRFEVQTKTLVGGAQVQPLVPVARSNDVNGAELSVGYGVAALAVGDVDPANAGYEVVAGAYRRLAVFDAETMRLLRGPVDAPWGAGGAYDYTQPHRLQVVECAAGNPGEEIVFTTLHGHLIVLNGELQVLAEHAESGVIDLLVGPTPPLSVTNPALDKPIYLFSARGHVARIEMDGDRGLPEMGRLAAASPLQFGKLWDMDTVIWEGSTHIVTLASDPPASERSIRLFDTSTLALATQFGNVNMPAQLPAVTGSTPAASPTAPISGATPKMAIVRDPAGNDTYMVLYADRLEWWFDPSDDLAEAIKDLTLFPPARFASAIEAGNLDGDPEDEIVISTLGGRLVWFEFQELITTGGDPGIPRITGLDANGDFWDHRTNASLAATWAFGLKPAEGANPPELHAIDRAGTWWQVDPATGVPTLVRNDVGDRGAGQGPRQATNVASLVYAGPGMTALQTGLAPGTPPSHENWEVFAGFPGPADFEVRTSPYLPDPDDFSIWFTPPLSPTSELLDGFWLLPATGDVWLDGQGNGYAAWWSKLYYPNLVQRVSYDLDAAGGPTLLTLWNTTGPDLGGARPPAPSAPGDGIALRTEFNGASVNKMQSLKLGHVIPNRVEPQAVVASLGGKVMVVDGSDPNGPILAQSVDLGFGGMAMALYDLDGDGDDEVLFGNGYTPVDGAGNPVGAHLHVLDYDTQAGTLDVITSVPIGDPSPSASHDLPGYGASGIAVADLTGATDPEVVVTTLNGELVVLPWDSTTQTFGPALYYQLVEGSIGAFNSIVVADLVGDSKKEIYIAGSMGIRRFDLQ